MASLLNPYLHFDADAHEAMTFYQSVFGGELDVTTYADMGMEGDDAAKVMHARLNAPHGLTLMASDSAHGMSVSPGDGVSLSLTGVDDAELRGWFAALAEGGSVSMPLEKQVWGDVYGQCTDRFGTAWMVNIERPAENAP